MAIIQKYGNGLPGPSCGEDEVNEVISVVDVDRPDDDAVRGTVKLNRLPARRTQLDLNPITCNTILVTQPALNGCYIGAQIPIEVGDCKLRTDLDLKGTP